MKSFLNTPEVLTYQDQVMAWLADGNWQSCKALQTLTSLSRTETHSALQQAIKRDRIETEHLCAGGKMRGITQRYRLKKRKHDV